MPAVNNELLTKYKQKKIQRHVKNTVHNDHLGFITRMQDNSTRENWLLEHTALIKSKTLHDHLNWGKHLQNLVLCYGSEFQLR